VPVASTDQFFYGGACGTPVVTITATVVDPGNGGGIVNVSIFFRLVNEAVGQATEWASLPMRNEGGAIWSRAFFSERDIPGYNTFESAALEYYIVAFNAAGLGAESPHYGVQSNPLTLSACPRPTPTQTPMS
jgi:hypothetical protein